MYTNLTQVEIIAYEEIKRSQEVKIVDGDN